MGNRESDLWAGVVLTVLVSTLALPVALDPANVQGPAAAWWVVFGLHLLGLTGSMWIAELLPTWALRTALTVTVLTAGAMVMLAPTAGWMPIVLIVSVAVCVYHLPLATVAAIVVANSACLLVALRLVDVPMSEAAMISGLYTLLQAVSALSAHAQVVVERSRTDLAVVNTELRSAQALLAESSRADERLRITRDLHDVMGHQLTALILELEVASHHSSGTAHDHVVTARAIARDLMADVRATVADHRTESPDLATALHQIVDGAAAIDVDLTVAAEVPTDGPAFTALVRCTQEVVTNALRHSGATRLWIDVSTANGHVVLSAQDDGVGTRTFVPGNGLRGIIERAEQLGGSAEFSSHDGFQVTARVPVA